MKKLCLYIILSVIAVSCQNPVVTNLSFEGDLYAKNTVRVKFNTVPGTETTFQWYIGDPGSDNWTVLPGIHTPEIVLLTDYAGKYLKCEIKASLTGKDYPSAEIVSKKPIADKGNPNTDWFKDAGLGLMVHYLKGVYIKEGGSEAWNAIVKGFDVNLFADLCEASGVKYVLWALGQNDGYYNSPNSAYDQITGVNPGDLCSKRDLPADLIKALKAKGIRFMFYLPGNPPISNEAVCEKFKYTYGKDSPTSQYTQALWESVIKEWSLRYGKDLSGWWFDGMYRDRGGIIQTRSDMSLEHNISTHTLAAKAGNPQSIVSYNYGVAAIQYDSPYDDYAAGERNDINELPSGRWIAPGIQWFHFTFLGDYWGRPGTKHKTEDLVDWAEKVFEKEGVMCFDVQVNAHGQINPSQMEQLKAVAKVLEKARGNK